jgi:hypothetical protein
MLLIPYIATTTTTTIFSFFRHVKEMLHVYVKVSLQGATTNRQL